MSRSLTMLISWLSLLLCGEEGAYWPDATSTRARGPGHTTGPGGTPVLTKKGLRLIETLRIGEDGGGGEMPANLPAWSAPGTEETIVTTRNGITGKVTRLAIMEMTDEIYKMVANGQMHWSKLPKMSEMKNRFAGLGSVGHIQPGDMHRHHLLEGRYFERLQSQINPLAGVQAVQHADDVPAFIIEAAKHTPSPGTVAWDLDDLIKGSTNPAVIKQAHQVVYQNHGLNDLLSVFNQWWTAQGLP